MRSGRCSAPRAPSPSARSCRASASSTRPRPTTARSTRRWARGAAWAADPRALRRGGHGLHRLRPAVRGDGACRHRVPGHPLGPHRAELADAAPVGVGGAEGALPRAAGARREARDLRPDRAGRRVGRGEPGVDRAPRRRSVHPQRLARSGSAWPIRPTTSSSSPTSTARRGTRASPRSSSSARFPGSRRSPCTASSAFAPATPASSPSTTARCRRRTASARRGRASRSR